jgi:hypothetical protein
MVKERRHVTRLLQISSGLVLRRVFAAAVCLYQPVSIHHSCVSVQELPAWHIYNNLNMYGAGVTSLLLAAPGTTLLSLQVKSAKFICLGHYNAEETTAFVHCLTFPAAQ